MRPSVFISVDLVTTFRRRRLRAIRAPEASEAPSPLGDLVQLDILACRVQVGEYFKATHAAQEILTESSSIHQCWF